MRKARRASGKRRTTNWPAPSFTARGILKKFNVTALCTTDDPTDDLAYHQKDRGGWRADARVSRVSSGQGAWRSASPRRSTPGWAVSNRQPTRTSSTWMILCRALRQRHDYFHAQGCRLSDHGLNQCPASPCPDKTAAAIFARARRGQAASPEEHAQFGTCLMLHFGRWDAEKGWVKQLHLGALRNNNTRLLERLGPDTGFDCIGDFPQAEALVRYLDSLEREGRLPKIIVYNSNPVDNYVFASIVGSFQDGSVPGKMQFGSGWWFLDQKEGIEWQLNALSNNGLLSRFVGMVTDSRSFMSYPRHEYFRRVLCNLIGQEVERGELPSDEDLLGTMISNICYSNAGQFSGLAGTAGDNTGTNAATGRRTAA